MKTTAENPMKTARGRTRVHRVVERRRRHRVVNISRYQLDSRMSRLFDGVVTAAQLRERFRAFVANDRVWDQIQAIVDGDRQQERNLDAFEQSCKNIRGRR